MNASDTVDVRDLNCPRPLLMTINAMKKLTAGDVLQVMTNTAGIKNDLPTWCSKENHTIVKHEEEGDNTIYYIQKF